MKNPYRIVSGATAHVLAQNVNAAMADGYVPTGGVQYVVHEDHALWVQAVAVPAPQPVAGPTRPTGIETRGARVNPDGIAIAAQACVRCDELKDDPTMRCPACPNKPRKAWQASTLEKMHAQDARQ
jgi:hypothetical protein